MARLRRVDCGDSGFGRRRHGRGFVHLDRDGERIDDADKFDSMARFAKRLPALRERVARDLALEGLPRERALACAVRLLDRGSFRIESEGYAEENDSYGLACGGVSGSSTPRPRRRSRRCCAAAAAGRIAGDESSEAIERAA